MSYTQHKCPNCGAPLPPPPPSGQVRCGYCATVLSPHAGAWKPAAAPAEDEPLLDPHRPRLWVGGARYCVLGRIARGESSDVFLARRDRRLTEWVVIKLVRALGDADLLEREARILEGLQQSKVQGTAHFSRLVPQLVKHGIARLGMHGQDGERPVAVYRHRSGFVHTFEDVFAAYPTGVAPEAAVWLWKRQLEVLGWLHESGWIHGALVPQHLLVHARDHGVAFTGWSCAVAKSSRAPLAAMPRQAQDYYPPELWEGGPAEPWHDVAMSARCVIRALGGQPASVKVPDVVPPPLASLLASAATGRSFGPGEPFAAAWAWRDELDAVARRVFGPSKYIPFTMPGWS